MERQSKDVFVLKERSSVRVHEWKNGRKKCARKKEWRTHGCEDTINKKIKLALQSDNEVKHN